MIEYTNPEVIVFNHDEALNWASPNSGNESIGIMHACGKNNPVDCMCASTGSKMKV